MGEPAIHPGEHNRSINFAAPPRAVGVAARHAQRSFICGPRRQIPLRRAPHWFFPARNIPDEAMADMIGGQIQFMCSNTPGALPQGGKVKAIALLARSRSQLMPELGTAHEQGLADVEANAWSGLFLPKGTPAAIVSKLNMAVSEAMDSNAVQNRMHELGATLVGADRRSPEYLQALVERETAKWGPPIKAAGISAD
jgi:hypothetical protein